MNIFDGVINIFDGVENIHDGVKNKIVYYLFSISIVHNSGFVGTNFKTGRRQEVRGGYCYGESATRSETYEVE